MQVVSLCGAQRGTAIGVLHLCVGLDVDTGGELTRLGNLISEAHIVGDPESRASWRWCGVQDAGCFAVAAGSDPFLGRPPWCL